MLQANSWPTFDGTICSQRYKENPPQSALARSAQMNVVFGCRAITRSRWACSSSRGGHCPPWNDQSGCSTSWSRRSLCRSAGVKNALGSPVWMTTGRPKRSQRSHRASILGSSTAISFPSASRRPRPRLLWTFRPRHRPGSRPPASPVPGRSSPPGRSPRSRSGRTSGTGPGVRGRAARSSPGAGRPSRHPG